MLGANRKSIALEQAGLSRMRNLYLRMTKIVGDGSRFVRAYHQYSFKTASYYHQGMR